MCSQRHVGGIMGVKKRPNPEQLPALQDAPPPIHLGHLLLGNIGLPTNLHGKHHRAPCKVITTGTASRWFSPSIVRPQAMRWAMGITLPHGSMSTMFAGLFSHARVKDISVHGLLEQGLSTSVDVRAPLHSSE